MRTLRIVWIVVFLGALVWSAIAPHDYPTWWLEVTPALIAALILWATRERFPLTTLTCVLILFHCIVLMVGGHYTYALVPAGEWLREALDQTRNNYDKLGHFTQGFVPAIVARELLIRLKVVMRAGWRVAARGLRPDAQQLRQARPLRAGLRAGHRGARTVDPAEGRSACPLARFPRRLHMPRDQRIL